MSGNYPFLHPVEPAPAAFEPISYPDTSVGNAPELAPEDNPVHLEKKCSVCGVNVDTALAHMVLECKHHTHFSCARVLFTKMKKMPNSIGGPGWCTTCSEVNATLGAHEESIYSELSFTRLIESLNSAHSRKFKRDVEQSFLSQVPTAELERKLLGPEGTGVSATAFLSMAVGSISSVVRSQPKEVWSETPGPEFDPLTIVSRLVAKKRTLDRIFESSDADIADLFVAGAQTLQDLQQLGFNLSVHLTPAYRKRLPIFALASHYQLSWDEHLANLPPKTIHSFRLSAGELRVLGCTMTSLVKMRWKATDVLNLGVAPSKLIKYVGMQIVHMHELGLTLDVCLNNERWARDFQTRDGAFRKLVTK